MSVRHDSAACVEVVWAILSGTEQLNSSKLNNFQKAWILAAVVAAEPDVYLYNGKIVIYPLERIVFALFGQRTTKAKNVVKCAQTAKLFCSNGARGSAHTFTFDPPPAFAVMMDALKDLRVIQVLHRRVVRQLCL